jgi:class 3 adenylate cyclase
VDPLRQWLETHGLAKYAGVLSENDVDLDVLPELTDADLRELGLSLGDRKRLLAALRSDGGEAPVSTDVPAPQTGDRREVTVLFCDLSGFTRLSAERDAEEVHETLSSYFAAVDEIVRAYGGTIDKHIGDTVMALFGAPVAHANDPERAVRSAAEIHRALARFDPPLVAHVGIASGTVVANQTGSAAYTEYTVTGSSVNLASRLQDLAEPGTTYVSDAVHGAVEALVTSEEVGEVEVKGFEAPVRVWRIADVPSEHGAGSRGTFVGRRAELRRLEGVLADCRETGAEQVVLVRGEPGIGKTQLVERYLEIAADLGMGCHTGLVLDFGAGRGRGAIPAILRSLLGLGATAGERERAGAVARSADQGLIDARDIVHLNELLDLPQPPDLRALYDAMDEQARSAGRHRVTAGLVEALARERPLLLRVEDIHWADRSLIDRLAELAQALAELPVVLVMTSRIEGDPIDAAWRARVRDCPLMTIDLGPLRPAEAEELAAAHFERGEELVRACIERAAGNPLFLDQLLRSVEDDGAGSVPGSVRSIVQMRVDNLDPDDRDALQAAAVLGQRFSPDAVAAITGNADYSCDDLHLRAAAWFRGQDAELHANHLESAGNPGAAGAYRDAASEALDAYRYGQARDLADRGIGCAGDAAMRFALRCIRADVLRLTGDAAASIRQFADALEDGEGPADEIRARLGLAEGMRIVDRLDEAFDEVVRVEALAEAGGDAGTLAAVHYLRGTSVSRWAGSTNAWPHMRRRSPKRGWRAGSTSRCRRSAGWATRTMCGAGSGRRTRVSRSASNRRARTGSVGSRSPICRWSAGPPC